MEKRQSYVLYLGHRLEECTDSIDQGLAENDYLFLWFRRYAYILERIG